MRCLVRSLQKVEARPWSRDPRVECIVADCEDASALAAAMRGCEAAYYLIHSMLAVGPEYAKHDQNLARSFATAAERAGVGRIIYLGGLGETGQGLSEHLSSRQAVEDALGSTSVPVTTLRAAMILGSGSASFEILRYLVERLPVMITPRWVLTENQPIAINDVLHYLVAALKTSATKGRTLEIGGPEVVTYRELMDVVARALGLNKRWVIQVPVLTPRLSSLWIHMVTPLSHRIARPLAEGLRNRVVCTSDEALQLMPLERTSVRDAIESAVADRPETSWSDAGAIPGDPDWAGGTTFVDRREIEIDAPCDRVFGAIRRIGGGNGWYAADVLWRLRGFLDRMVGGPGLRRGRRHPESLAYGDALDFWRVTGIEPGRRLQLRAEMKLPGVATLEFDLLPTTEGRCHLVQTARFQPRGLLGLLYWISVLPLHGFVFRGMLRGIQRHSEDHRAEDRPSEASPTPQPP